LNHLFDQQNKPQETSNYNKNHAKHHSEAKSALRRGRGCRAGGGSGSRPSATKEMATAGRRLLLSGRTVVDDAQCIRSWKKITREFSPIGRGSGAFETCPWGPRQQWEMLRNPHKKRDRQKRKFGISRGVMTVLLDLAIFSLSNTTKLYRIGPGPIRNNL